MKDKEEISELEEELEEVEEEQEESEEESKQEIPERNFREFLNSREVEAPVLERIASAQTTPDFEEEISDFQKNSSQEKNIEYIPKTETEYISRNPKKVETARTIQRLTPEIRRDFAPFRQQQNFAIETEADRMMGEQSERGEYIVNVKNVDIERHLPFEDPERKYREKPIR